MNAACNTTPKMSQRGRDEKEDCGSIENKITRNFTLICSVSQLYLSYLFEI
jgi:hypothetical protein